MDVQAVTVNCTAQHWSSAAAPSGLVEKMFHESIDSVMVVDWKEEERDACALVRTHQIQYPIYGIRTQHSPPFYCDKSDKALYYQDVDQSTLWDQG